MKMNYRRYTKKNLSKNIFERFYYRLSVTNWIILINVLVFIVVSGLFYFKIISIDAIALNPSLILQGRNLWTLVTSIFMHGSLIHLFFNMFSLFFIGNFVEKLIGRRRFAAFYLLAGIGAGIFFVLLSGFFGVGIFSRIFGDPTIPGVGASGAIFGLVGILALLTPKNRVFLIVGPLVAIILQYIINPFIDGSFMVVLNFFITAYIFISIFSLFSFNSRLRKIAIPLEMPFWVLPVVAIVPLVIIGLFFPLPIGNSAHLGGLIVGLVFAWYLKKKYRRKTDMINKMFR